MPDVLALHLLLTATLAAQPAPDVIEAVHKGHAVGREQDGVNAVRAAIAAGGSVNQRDKTGWTPLMHAALECRSDIVKLLLEHKADPNAQSSRDQQTTYLDHGHTALLIASGCFIARRRAQLAPERKMPPEYANYELDAPRRMVALLLAHGANPNATDVHGRTPLMMAAMQSWPRAIELLLAAKAGIREKDNQGRTMLDYADPTSSETIAVLRKAGAPKATGASGRTTCDAERALDKLGYNTPIIDCIAGDQLATVIRKFQKDRKLDETGLLDAGTKKELGIR